MNKNGAGHLARQAIRQAIWETLNRHKPSGKPNIALVGSRRSGSTLLMQVIAQNRGVKSVDQPFSPFNATPHQMQFLPAVAGGHYIALNGEQESRLRRYLEHIFSGEIHVREPWQFWRRDFHFVSDRIVLKTTNAHFVEGLLASLDCQMIRYFRHPISQSLSCIRNSWSHQLSAFAQSRPLVDGILNYRQRNLLFEVMKSGSALEKHILSWCLENMPIFRSANFATLYVFYERIILEPACVIRTIADHCELDNIKAMHQMIKEPSRSTKNLSESSTLEAISARQKEILIARWTKEVSAVAELSRIQNILDQFEGCPYRVESPSPTSELPGGARVA